MPDRAVDLLFDSGAYSAWRSGATIDLEAYIDFCLEHADSIYKVINLDVIPGKPHQPRSAAAVEASAADGWKNLLRMRKRGIEAMPVFHQGESFAWLERMIGEGFAWIGLSSQKGTAWALGHRKRWLDDVFAFACARGGYPSIKFHGFAETHQAIMFRYPWYSLDSTTWLLQSAYSKIPFPRTTGRQIDWCRQPYYAFIGKAGDEHNTRWEDSFYHLSAGTQDAIRAFVRELGFEFAELEESAKARSAYTAAYIQHIIGKSTLPKMHAVPRYLGDGIDQSPHGRKAPAWLRVRMFFATGPGVDNAWALTRAGARNRLLSYIHFKKSKRVFDLDEYVRTGLVADAART